MKNQLFYDSAEGMYWYEDKGEPKFYAWAEEVTVEEAESAIDKVIPGKE